MFQSVFDFLSMFRTNKTSHIVPFRDIYVSSLNKLIMSRNITSITIESPFLQTFRHAKPLLVWFLVDFSFYELYITNNSVVDALFTVFWGICLLSLFRGVLPTQTVLLKVKSKDICFDEFGAAGDTVTLKYSMPVLQYLTIGWFFKSKVVTGDAVYDFFPNRVDNELNGKPFATGEALTELEEVHLRFIQLNKL